LLRCLLYIDKAEKVFTVEIERNKDVSILKKLIKEEAPISLGDVETKDLILLNVNLLLEDDPDSQLVSLDHETCPTLSPLQPRCLCFSLHPQMTVCTSW